MPSPATSARGGCALDDAGRVILVNPEAELLSRDWGAMVHGGRAGEESPLDAVRGGGRLPQRRRSIRAPGWQQVRRGLHRRAEAERAAPLARVEAAPAFRTHSLAITTHSPLTVRKRHAPPLLRQRDQGSDQRLLATLARSEG